MHSPLRHGWRCPAPGWRGLPPVEARRRRAIALAALRFDKLSPAAAAFVETTRKARKHWVMD
jgi:hypothetical protein